MSDLFRSKFAKLPPHPPSNPPPNASLEEDEEMEELEELDNKHDEVSGHVTLKSLIQSGSSKTEAQELEEEEEEALGSFPAEMPPPPIPKLLGRRGGGKGKDYSPISGRDFFEQALEVEVPIYEEDDEDHPARGGGEGEGEKGDRNKDTAMKDSDERKLKEVVTFRVYYTPPRVPPPQTEEPSKSSTRPATTSSSDQTSSSQSEPSTTTTTTTTPIPNQPLSNSASLMASLAPVPIRDPSQHPEPPIDPPSSLTATFPRNPQPPSPSSSSSSSTSFPTSSSDPSSSDPPTSPSPNSSTTGALPPRRRPRTNSIPLPTNTTTYRTSKSDNGTLFVFHHGAGYGGLSAALMCKELIHLDERLSGVAGGNATDEKMARPTEGGLGGFMKAPWATGTISSSTRSSNLDSADGKNKSTATTSSRVGFMSYDARGHGKTKVSHKSTNKISKSKPSTIRRRRNDGLSGGGDEGEREVEEMSLERLTDDFVRLMKSMFPDREKAPRVVLVGHSMGGAVVTTACNRLIAEVCDVVGLSVLDVVEGSALDALKNMKQVLASRPEGFDTVERAIEWHLRSQTIRNLASARVSVPPLLRDTQEPDETIEGGDKMDEDNDDDDDGSRTPTKASPSTEMPPPPPPPTSTSTSSSVTTAHLPQDFDLDMPVPTVAPWASEPMSQALQEGFRRGEERERINGLQFGGGMMGMRGDIGGRGRPVLGKRKEMKWKWRTELGKTEEWWEGWFVNLSSKFLDAKTGKLLILAGADRLDRELTIGQMQGKYQLTVLQEVGHCLHEDDPVKVAKTLHQFWKRNDVTDILKGVKKVGET